jgi:hypothetical protein
VQAIASPEFIPAAARLHAAYAALQPAAMPHPALVQLRRPLLPGLVRVSHRDPTSTRIVTYSDSDPLELPTAIVDLLPRFDGRPTELVLAELAREGVVLDPELLASSSTSRSCSPPDPRASARADRVASPRHAAPCPPRARPAARLRRRRRARNEAPTRPRGPRGRARPPRPGPPAPPPLDDAFRAEHIEFAAPACASAGRSRAPTSPRTSAGAPTRSPAPAPSCTAASTCAARSATSSSASAPASSQFAGTDPLLGNLVIVDHGLGVTSFYGHMSDILVHTGLPVDRGVTLGLVGNTGRSEAPHLHLTVKLGDFAVDPLWLIGAPLHPYPALASHISEED